MTTVVRSMERFFAKETSAGLMLMAATVLAMVAANSPLGPLYEHFLNMRVTFAVDGVVTISKAMILWINDGLMAIFFFMVGLEIKRELLEGELSSFDRATLPLLAAIGGMAGPALIYAAVNWGNPETIDGWAIPAATDIAFALGILALLGTRAPVSLKIFLLAIAIIDDLGAIVIIALFYSHEISVGALVAAVCGLVLAVGMNIAGVRRGGPYVVVALVIWVCVLKSGVHATLAGVLMALTVPLRPIDGKPPLAPRMEHALHEWVNFLILPVFAFANAGLNLGVFNLDTLMSPVPLGIALGLVFGKMLGVFLVTLATVGTGLMRGPQGVSWLQLYGAACLTGIGFTMSLFIGGLAFPEGGTMDQVRAGVLIGSVISGVLGYVILYRAHQPKLSAVEA